VQEPDDIVHVEAPLLARPHDGAVHERVRELTRESPVPRLERDANERADRMKMVRDLGIELDERELAVCEVGRVDEVASYDVEALLVLQLLALAAPLGPALPALGKRLSHPLVRSTEGEERVRQIVVACLTHRIAIDASSRVLLTLGTMAVRSVEVPEPPQAVESRRGLDARLVGGARLVDSTEPPAAPAGESPRIEPGDLPEMVHGLPLPQPSDESLVRLPAKIEWLEERAIRAALQATGGNQKQAALLLGFSRNTLHRKLRPD
jgi:hypothetical protein